jgi:hypothetical protein
MKPIIAYYRVSTQKQARSGKKGLGLGLEAQREALERFTQANGLQIAYADRASYRCYWVRDRGLCFLFDVVRFDASVLGPRASLPKWALALAGNGIRTAVKTAKRHYRCSFISPRFGKFARIVSAT